MHFECISGSWNSFSQFPFCFYDISVRIYDVDGNSVPNELFQVGF
jgi:hypothetical protein